MNYTYKSFVPAEMSDIAHDLFFFNPDQGRYKRRIERAIAAYGKPEWIERDELFSIRLANPLIEQQTIFICDKLQNEKPVAVIICVKGDKFLDIVHLARNKQNAYENIFFDCLPKIGQIVSAKETFKAFRFAYSNLFFYV